MKPHTIVMHPSLTKASEVQVKTHSGTEVRFINFEEKGYLEMIVDDELGERASVLMNVADIDEVCKAMWICAETAESGGEVEEYGTEER
ncbi:hypothetical protein EXIGUO8H_20367 [Exiguobacterium sp. 8H]|uniref:hypothetical protein n=1 Tax=unclassified Exiguobacterium TaxID=2644629 RepID=UPI0012F43904|nr:MULTISPECIES: hypothetical protein [unclassified Exiguobacterium]VXB52903.1 hypothetical protein EXIGUO8A_11436 [Exiguobacterium sp. 8A]VXB53481.1 hypothetical protein EXIGUO8H_20367 [Exiguobacterium sp. 8H]